MFPCKMTMTLSSFLFTFAMIGFSASTTITNRTADPFGLIIDDVAYHLLCDQGKAAPLKPAVPRACFETTLHVARNLRDPSPSKLDGFIDGSGKRFMLRPDATVTLRDIEIHVTHSANIAGKEHDPDCTDVKLYRLPKRDVKALLTWCPGKLLPILV